MNQQLIADLKASKAELEKRGWTKGRLVREDSTVCALGAIGCALVEGFEGMETSREKYYALLSDRVRPVVKAVAAQTPDSGIDELDAVYSKNDAFNTRLEDVYNLFDKALAEEGGLL